ncbi:hypothetical protein [Vibrio gallicus]|uniref:hypothetical protein n=1 Tax=Vibrio gallicus TaxID=190897 RepID=UPI0021C269E2|nr:hypothetical protein [Vibrio gallicus]
MKKLIPLVLILITGHAFAKDAKHLTYNSTHISSSTVDDASAAGGSFYATDINNGFGFKVGYDAYSGDLDGHIVSVGATYNITDWLFVAPTFGLAKTKINKINHTNPVGGIDVMANVSCFTFGGGYYYTVIEHTDMSMLGFKLGFNF